MSWVTEAPRDQDDDDEEEEERAVVDGWLEASLIGIVTNPGSLGAPVLEVEEGPETGRTVAPSRLATRSHIEDNVPGPLISVMNLVNNAPAMTRTFSIGSDMQAAMALKS